MVLNIGQVSGVTGRVNDGLGFNKGANSASWTNNTTIAPDGTKTAATLNLTNNRADFDYKKIYEGLTANTAYTFSVWARAGTASSLSVSVNDNTAYGTISGDTQFTLQSNNWARYDLVFTTTSSGTAQIMLGSAPTTETGSVAQPAGTVYVWGAELNKGDATTLSSVLANLTVANLTADARVNANGFHKLYGFEVIDLSQNAGAQKLTVTAADVNQLSDQSSASGAKQLWVKLDSADAIVASGFSSTVPTYGYYSHTESDGSTTIYDRKWTGTDTPSGGSAQNVELYSSFGQYAPGFTSANYSSTTLTLVFDENILGTTSANDWTLSGGSTHPTTATLSGTGNVNLALAFGSVLSGVVSLDYSGSTLLDSAGQGLRYSKLLVGTSAQDTSSGAGSGLDQSNATANVALFGNGGNDVMKGGSGSDLLVVSGNATTNLTGGSGADVFKFAQFAQGTSNIADFHISEGDKLDLGDLLTGTGYTTASMANYLNLTSNGNTSILQVDTSGSGSFTNPALVINMANTANVNGTDDVVNTTLVTMMNQRVILT